MARALYALVENTPVTIPANPGNTVAYLCHRGLTRAKKSQIDTNFKRQKNYFLTYINVYPALFGLLDDVISDAFKISNQAGQTGWNSTMAIDTI